MNHRKHSPIQLLCMLLVTALMATPAGVGTEATDNDASAIQNDAESGGDAPDDCVTDSPSHLDLISDGTYGQLIPGEDPRDVYTITLKDGETRDIVQDLASSEATTANLYLPHTPHAPHVAETLHEDEQNPFAMDILDRDCRLVAASGDASVLPRTITLNAPGTYQILIRESGATTTAAQKTDGEGLMCHPPCRLDGYVIDHTGAY